jgi:hypothetical protein
MNVTKAARQETTRVVKTMLDLHDSVHHIQLTIKDVMALEEFKSVSEDSVFMICAQTSTCSSFNY